MNRLPLELCQELAAADFPWGTYFWWVVRGNGPEVLDKTAREEHSEYTIMLYACPTLSELLAALDDRTGKILLDGPSVDNDSRWLAIMEGWDGEYAEGTGDTPEEAVARLYLALKKEKT